MKYSIVLTKKDYIKFEKAYNKRKPFSCKGFNINLVACSSDDDLFSIKYKDQDTFINVDKIEQSYFGTTSIFGNDCIIRIHESKPIDITLKMDSGMIPRPKKTEKVFSIIFK